MPKQNNPTEKAGKLRWQAEKLARAKGDQSPLNTAALSSEEVQQVFHDLKVYQIELEMQIDELKRVQAELDTERESYFNLFEMAPVGYCAISENGSIDKINLTASKMLGMSRSALLKQPLTRFIFKQDQDIYFLRAKQLRETGEPQNFELRMLRVDDSVFWLNLEFTAGKEADGTAFFLAALSDITVHKQLEEELREIESRMQFSLDNCQIGAWDLDLNDHSAHRTPGHDRIFGYQALLPQWTYEMFLQHVLPEDRHEVDRKFSEAIRTQTTWNFECRIRRIDGEICWIWVAGRPSKPVNGNMRSMAGVVQDITERKQVEEKLRESLEKLKQSYQIEKNQRQELQQEAQARGLFIDILGHELRTPLTPLAVYSAMLQDLFGSHNEGLERKLVENVYSGTKHLTERLEELLELGKFSRGSFILHKQPVAIKDLVNKIAAQFKPFAQQKSRQLNLEIQDGLPVIEADPVRLEQVLLNLLSNALKYGPENSRITLKVGRIEDDIVIEVQDEGAVPPPEEQKKFFDPYHVVKQDTLQHPGAGLGLAICKQIVAAHRGCIRIESHSDKKTCFRVEIPVKIQENCNEIAAG